MVTKLKAAFLSPNAVTKTEIRKGPAPLPMSSVVLRRANAGGRERDREREMGGGGRGVRVSQYLVSLNIQ
jgi:hypothetical protein